MEIKNRIVMAPMNTVMSLDNRGYVNEQILAYYAARAKGGCGLIITECVLGTQAGGQVPVHLQPALLRRVVRARAGRSWRRPSTRSGPVPSSRCPSASAGRATPTTARTRRHLRRSRTRSRSSYWRPGFPEVLEKYPVLAPSGPWGSIPYEMTIDEIHAEQDEFANSCIFAMIAQFDGIELHAPHGYLEHQFLSPRTNKRTDMYGGSLENRMRFLVEVYLKVREAVGPDYLVGMRLSADEHMPDGFTHEEALEVARVMTQLGVDYVHLSDGSYEALKYFFPDKDGTMLDEAANFKQGRTSPGHSALHPRPEERGEGDRKRQVRHGARSAGRCWPTRNTATRSRRESRRTSSAASAATSA